MERMVWRLKGHSSLALMNPSTRRAYHITMGRHTPVLVSSKQPDPCPDIYHWHSEWQDITSDRQGLCRQFCDQATQQCVATEYLSGVAHLVKYISLPDKSLSASLELDGLHAVKRVHTDNNLVQLAPGSPLSQSQPWTSSLILHTST